MICTLATNRRREPRYYYYSGVRIKWRPDQLGMRPRRAWVHNISNTGIALLIPKPYVPNLGDGVELWSPSQTTEHFQVVRVEHSAEELAVVGCRSDAGARRSAPPLPHRPAPQQIERPPRVVGIALFPSMRPTQRPVAIA